MHECVHAAPQHQQQQSCPSAKPACLSHGEARAAQTRTICTISDNQTGCMQPGGTNGSLSLAQAAECQVPCGLLNWLEELLTQLSLCT